MNAGWSNQDNFQWEQIDCLIDNIQGVGEAGTVLLLNESKK